MGIMTLGVTGPIGGGKDTFCDYAGATKIGFADKLKEVCHNLTGHDYNIRDTKDSEVLPGVTGRKLLETIGATMRALNKNYWVDIALEKAKRYDNVVIPDTRYDNEVEAIRKLGGKIVRINRPGCQRTGHESDNWDKLDVDYEIDNSGTLEEFHENIKKCLDALLF
jgi:dephospho-CoA kinase